MTSSYSFRQSHIGLCVSDLGVALRFYRDGLGCEDGPYFNIDHPISEMSGDVRLVSKFVRSGDLRIELLAFAAPTATGVPSSKRNELGLTHLSFKVEDIDIAAARLVAHGGTVIEGTRSCPEGGVHIIFVADPDGTRVELMAFPPDYRWPWH